MLEQELKKIWTSPSKTTQISFETTQLIEELILKINSIQKKIRIRNIIEICASVVGILIFAYLIYEIPFPLTKSACILAFIWFAFVIFKFRESNTHNIKIDFSSSLIERLNDQKILMIQQAKLLNSSLYWYCIPPFLMNFIFIIGLEDPIDYDWNNSIAESLLPLAPNFKTIILTGLGFFYAFSFWVNKRALYKDVNPIIKSIEKMEKEIKAIEK